ncbi:hypothetical protein C8J35_102158 [Rhizobium sp. PP-F2F-G38]|nr:hypothetical protein C8J37_102159 [Rhizobium sp. PP-WC-1G-195]PYE99270.1 hypothetical protein C8J35_102158 [Rhizobium sp. PP-F2F-G38]
MKEKSSRWRRVLYPLLIAFVGGVALIVISVGLEINERRKMIRGESGPFDATEADIDGRHFRLERYLDHLFLAEFRRTLTVTAKGRAPVVFEMDQDTGGVQRIAVCKTGEGLILLSDRIFNYLIDPDGTTKPFPTPEVEPVCVTKLGTFDKGLGPRGRYGFQPER